MNSIKMFVPLNENREVFANEWFIDEDGDFIKWHDREETIGKYDIYRLEEIQIPEGANRLSMQLYGCIQDQSTIHIDLPQPKVKKWKWTNETIGRHVPLVTWKKYTEEEMKEYGYSVGSGVWHKVEGSEIEV
jgi:hypothetical protein